MLVRIRAYIHDPVYFHYAMTPLVYFFIGIFVTSGLIISYRAIVQDDEPDKKILQKAGYLDSSNPKYSAKLAAAVQAWMIISEKEELKSSPKQCIEKFFVSVFLFYLLLDVLLPGFDGYSNKEQYH